jgi:hypothetical protein
MKNLTDHTDLTWPSLWVTNLVADKVDPNGRNIQAGLADRIG